MGRVKIDVEKLIKIIQTRGISLEQFGYSIGRSRNYIGSLRKNDTVPESVLDLICERLDIDPEELKETKSGEKLATEINEIVRDSNSILCDLHKILIDHHKMLLEQKEMQTDILNKVKANTIQLAKIKDAIEEIKQTEYERAEKFLREALKDGKVSSFDLMQKADDNCIKRSELMKAKGKLEVKIYATGYGKNQKSWWSLS